MEPGNLDLTVLVGGWTLPVQPGHTFIVGRDEGCSFVIPRPDVSRQHLRVWWDGEWIVENMSTANGTFHHGTRITRERVSQRMELVLGEEPDSPTVVLIPPMAATQFAPNGPNRGPHRPVAPRPAGGGRPAPAGGWSAPAAPQSAPHLPEIVPPPVYAPASPASQVQAPPPPGQAPTVQGPYQPTPPPPSFPADGVTLGRDPRNVVVVRDPEASRFHARIDPTATGVLVTDLRSSNGTLVNGAQVSATPANIGDVITIGKTHYRITPGGVELLT